MLKEKISNLYSGVNDYVDKKIELTRIEIISASSKSFSKMASGVIFLLMVFSFMFFVGLTAAIFLSELFDSYLKGFGAMALFFLLLIIVFLVVRKKYIERKIYEISILMLSKEVDNNEHK
jgi:hypothetical protein